MPHDITKLTGRQLDGLRELARYGAQGAMQKRLVKDGTSRSLLINLWGKGLAETMNTSIGRAWFISADGRAALQSGVSNA